jgi:hypothetical protein
MSRPAARAPRAIRLTLRIAPAVHRALRRAAARRGIPDADLARACLEHGLTHFTDQAPPRALAARWDLASSQIHQLLRRPGQSGWRTALLRRLAGLSVDRWDAVDAWMEERAGAAPTHSARRLATEALVYFGLSAKVRPALVALAQRVRHRLYMRAARDAASVASPDETDAGSARAPRVSRPRSGGGIGGGSAEASGSHAQYARPRRS